MTLKAKICTIVAIFGFLAFEPISSVRATDYSDDDLKQCIAGAEIVNPEICPEVSQVEPRESLPVTTAETNRDPIPEPASDDEATPDVDNPEPASEKDLGEVENCIDSKDMNCGSEVESSAELAYWPVILSACALGATVLLFIIINLFGRKKQ